MVTFVFESTFSSKYEWAYVGALVGLVLEFVFSWVGFLGWFRVDFLARIKNFCGSDKQSVVSL